MRPAGDKTRSSSRLGFIDWTRGLAGAIMLQGHVFHSFTATGERAGSAYVLTQFVGGMPPAMFLFLTGITFGFLMDSSAKKGLSFGARLGKALRRSGYLFVLAYAFRLQMFVTGQPSSPWSDLLKVDILNCMGFAMAATAIMAVFTTAERIRHCAVLGVAIAVASPLVAAVDWSGTHPMVRMYLAPDANWFGFFPWASFLAFGMSAGSILRSVKPEQMERLMQWAALAGFGLILGGRYAADLPYSLYASSDFWIDGPMLIFIKTGIILVILSFAWVWHTYVIQNRWSWLCQIGTTSLLVYWVHTELVYGRWLWRWKESLSVTQTTGAAVGVILLMTALSVARTHWRELRAVLPYPRWRGAGARAD